MSVRHIALAVLAVLVMGMCVFLFLEVRSSPAAPQPRGEVAKAAEVKETDGGNDSDNEREAKLRSGSRPYTPGLRNMARKVQNEKTGDAGAPSGGAPALASEEVPAGDKLEGPKLDAVMAEANRAYDKMDFDEARSIAQKVLKQHPANSRMLRIMTSAYCIENDNAEAQKYFNRLPGPDREQMKTRCARYGVAFTDPPATTK